MSKDLQDVSSHAMRHGEIVGGGVRKPRCLRWGFQQGHGVHCGWSRVRGLCKGRGFYSLRWENHWKILRRSDREPFDSCVDLKREEAKAGAGRLLKFCSGTGKG